VNTRIAEFRRQIQSLIEKQNHYQRESGRLEDKLLARIAALEAEKLEQTNDMHKRMEVMEQAMLKHQLRKRKRSLRSDTSSSSLSDTSP
jgi:phage host-nuclease inhibitor protein Gam